jgi:hypothetical protein
VDTRLVDICLCGEANVTCYTVMNCTQFTKYGIPIIGTTISDKKNMQYKYLFIIPPSSVCFVYMGSLYLSIGKQSKANMHFDE